MRTYDFALTLLTTCLCGGSLLACQGAGTGTDMGKHPDMATHFDLTPPAPPKGVYTTNNDPNDNQLYIYSRAADGTLTAQTPVSTAGRGTGAGLGSQGSLVFDPKQDLFIVANGGDNSISMLQLKQDGTVQLLFNTLSGGIKPVSVTISGSYVYVVNAGNNFNSPNISGFQITGNVMTPIANSMKNLSATGVGPGQIQFSPDGTLLVVTEKMSSKIDTFLINSGVASSAIVQNSNGNTPFGFAWSSAQQLIVSEANVGPPALPGTASSYSISSAGMLTTVTNKLTDNQMAPCWTVVAGNTAYLTNAASNNISAYTIGAGGSLTLLANGVSGTTGMHPTDEAVTQDNLFLYTLNTNDHTISAFGINTDGSLTKKADTQGVPTNAVGLVAR